MFTGIEVLMEILFMDFDFTLLLIVAVSDAVGLQLISWINYSEAWTEEVKCDFHRARSLSSLFAFFYEFFYLNGIPVS